MAQLGTLTLYSFHLAAYLSAGFLVGWVFLIYSLLKTGKAMSAGDAKLTLAFFTLLGFFAVPVALIAGWCLNPKNQDGDGGNDHRGSVGGVSPPSPPAALCEGSGESKGSCCGCGPYPDSPSENPEKTTEGTSGRAE